MWFFAYGNHWISCLGQGFATIGWNFSYFIKNQEEFITLFCEKFDIKKPNKIEVVGNVNPEASWLRKNKYWDKNIEKKMRHFLISQIEFAKELKTEILLHEMISKKRFAILDSLVFKDITLEKSKYLNWNTRLEHNTSVFAESLENETLVALQIGGGIWMAF